MNAWYYSWSVMFGRNIGNRLSFAASDELKCLALLSDLFFGYVEYSILAFAMTLSQTIERKRGETLATTMRSFFFIYVFACSRESFDWQFAHFRSFSSTCDNWIELEQVAFVFQVKASFLHWPNRQTARKKFSQFVLFIEESEQVLCHSSPKSNILNICACILL